MTVAKPTLTAYSPGDLTGYTITAANYNTEVLQQGAWTQLMLEPQTSFPSGPATNDTCFRSDLGAWFRYDGAAWQQMGPAFFTTANRPASPPTGFVYFDTTTNALYYYTGSAYAGIPASALVAPIDLATNVAATVPLTVENTNVTPTGDLTQWKNNGAVVAKILAGGGLTFTTPAGAIAQEAWTAPTLLNSWVNFGAGFQTAGYFKDTEGVVHLRGLVGTGNVGTTIWTLGVGYRPALAILGASSSNGSFAEFRVQGGGAVSANSGTNGAYFSLDCITFDGR